MVGVNMRIYDVADLHSAFFGNLQVRLGIIYRVAHGGQAFAASAENI
jgi:hypothetical protein